MTASHTWGWRLRAEGVAWRILFSVLFLEFIFPRRVCPSAVQAKALCEGQAAPSFLKKCNDMSWAQGQGANLYFQHRALTASSAVDVALDKDDAGSHCQSLS